MDDNLDELELRLMQQFLDDADPIEWFVTALALYWHSQPGYHQAFASEEEVPGVNRSGWQVIHRLQERLTGG